MELRTNKTISRCFFFIPVWEICPLGLSWWPLPPGQKVVGNPTFYRCYQTRNRRETVNGDTSSGVIQKISPHYGEISFYFLLHPQDRWSEIFPWDMGTKETKIKKTKTDGVLNHYIYKKKVYSKKFFLDILYWDFPTVLACFSLFPVLGNLAGVFIQSQLSQDKKLSVIMLSISRDTVICKSQLCLLKSSLAPSPLRPPYWPPFDKHPN